MKRTLHLFSVLTLIFWMFLNPVVCQGQNETIVYVAPVIYTAEPGQSFLLDIMIENVADLFAFDVTVNFEPDYLKIDSVEMGDFLEEGITFSLNTEGSIQFVNTQKGTEIPAKSGSGTLFTIHFTVQNREGETRVEIDENATELSDNNDYQLIPFKTRDGTVFIGDGNRSFAVYLPLMRN